MGMNLDPSLLTEEEIAAINGTEGGDEDAEALKSIAAGADDSGDDDADDADDETGEGDEGDSAAEGDQAQAAAAPAAGGDPAAADPASGAAAADAQGDAAADQAARSVDEDDDPPVAPVFVYKLPEDFKDRVKAVDDAEEAAEAKFEAGELTNAEYRQEIRRIGKERSVLDNMQSKAELAAEAQAQAEQMVLRSAFQAAVKAGAEVGIDYKGDQAKFKQLDAMVKALATDDANTGRSAKSLLLEAHRAVMALNGVKAKEAAPATAPAGKPAAQVKAEASARRKPDLSGVPKTLAQVPGGDGPGDVGGEFDDILALDGEAYEQTLEQMARTAPARFAAFQAYRPHR